MTVHARSMLAFGLAALLAAPALAQDPAPADTAVKIDLPPVAERPSGQRLPGKVILVRPAHARSGRRPHLLRGGAGLDLRGAGKLRHRPGRRRSRGGDDPDARTQGRRAAQQSRWMPLVSVPTCRSPPRRRRRPGGASWRVRAAWAHAGATPPWPTRAAPSSSSSPPRVAIRWTPTRRRPAGSGPSSGPTTPRARRRSTGRSWATTFWQVGAGKQATWIYASGGRPRARVARMPFDKVPAQWLPYVVVKDLNAALGRVPELNGHVLRKPGAKGPQFAVVSDPGGAAFILEQRPEQPRPMPRRHPPPRREPRPTWRRFLHHRRRRSRPTPTASMPRSRRRRRRPRPRRSPRRPAAGEPTWWWWRRLPTPTSGSRRRPGGRTGEGWAGPIPRAGWRALVGDAPDVGPRVRAPLLSGPRRLLPRLPAAPGSGPPRSPAPRTRLPAARGSPAQRRRSGVPSGARAVRALRPGAGRATSRTRRSEALGESP